MNEERYPDRGFRDNGPDDRLLNGDEPLTFRALREAAKEQMLGDFRQTKS
jgi:hypothetical protein